MNRKVTAIVLAAISATGLTACISTPVDATPAPAPTVTVTATAAPKPAPTVTRTITKTVEVPVPGPTVTVTATAPQSDAQDFSPATHPATLAHPYGGAPIPYPTVPGGMRFEEDDTVAYPEWVALQQAKGQPVGSFPAYRAAYVGSFPDARYTEMQSKGYALIPEATGGFLAFRVK